MLRAACSAPSTFIAELKRSAKMNSEKNKSLVHAYAAAFNCGDLDAVCSLFASNAVIYGVKDGEDLPTVRLLWGQLISAFGLQLNIQALCCEGNTVVARYIESGRFTSAFRGFLPTNLSYEVVAIHWFEIDNSKIIRRWGCRDTLSISRQIGIQE